MQQRAATTIAGRVRSTAYFSIRSVDRFDPAIMAAVLSGEHAGAVFRSAVDKAACARVAQNFWHHPLRLHFEDAVPTSVLGTFHDGKTLEAYFDDVARFRDLRRDIFADTIDVFAGVMQPLGATIGRSGIVLRVAGHGGREAAPFVLRSWSGGGEFALEPHEDGAQLGCPRQRGFEIQQVAHAPAALAVNICLENAGEGDLHYWNLEPDATDRAMYGTSETGCPYPSEALRGLQRIVVPIRAGDLYCFNSRLVHAVSGHGGGTGRRSTISWRMGFTDATTVIYWS